MEVESGGQLPFLDVLIHRETDGSISTSVYKKASHTDCYLDFRSHHPISHKRSVVSTLLSRVGTHSSTPDLERAENERMVLALSCNGYPAPLISQQALCLSRGSVQCDGEDWLSTTVIPYVQGVSEAVRRILTPLSLLQTASNAQTVAI